MASKEYDIARAAGICAECGKELSPGEEFIATLKEAGDELLREDYCPACWSGRPADSDEDPDLLGTWQTRTPQPKEKKKLFIDDELLVNFFERLAGAESSVKISLRYVLALVLMRKRLLIYDGTERLDDGAEIWKMHLKGSDKTHSVIDPKMDAEQVAEVSRQLGQIMEGEL